MDTLRAPEQVVVLVGTKGAGKSTIAHRFAERGFLVRATSDGIRAELARRGNNHPTVLDLIAEGNRGRREHSLAYWTLRALQELRDRGASRMFIDGVRHPGEIKALRRSVPRGSFFLFGVDAPIFTRYERFRLRARSGDPTSFEQFVLIDDRDRGKGDPQEPPDGQQVDRTLAMVPQGHVYYNTGTLLEYHVWIDSVFERIAARTTHV